MNLSIIYYNQNKIVSIKCFNTKIQNAKASTDAYAIHAMNFLLVPIPARILQKPFDATRES